MRSARSPIALAAVAGMVALAGCGEDRGSVKVETAGGGTETEGTSTAPGAAAPPGRAVATVRIDETEFRLAPARPAVARKGVVLLRVRNLGTVVHALEVEGPRGEARTEQIQPGRSATLKVALGKAGSYEMYCPIDDHKGKGMKGEVVVAGGGPSGQGTATSEDKTSTSAGGRYGY